jgi:chromosome segregation ATPase
MGLAEHSDFLRRLSAASVELEELRAELETLFREESRAGDGQDNAESDHEGVQEYIGNILVQCKELRPGSRRLVRTVSQAVEQQGQVPSERRSHADLQSQIDAMVSAADTVEDLLQELLDSIHELIERLPENGGEIHGRQTRRGA